MFFIVYNYTYTHTYTYEVLPFSSQGTGRNSRTCVHSWIYAWIYVCV